MGKQNHYNNMFAKLTIAGSLLATAFSSPLDPRQLVRRDDSTVLLELPKGAFGPAIEGASVNKAGDVFAVDLQKETEIATALGYGFFNQAKDGVKNVLGDDNPLFVVKNDTAKAPFLAGARFINGGKDVLLADANNMRVLTVNVETKESSVLCSDPKMLQPNDIAVSSQRDCLIYLSGQNYTTDSVAGKDGDLWTCDSGKATQFDPAILKKADIHRTNGVEASPDGTSLYVTSVKNVAGKTTGHRIFKFALDKKTGALLNEAPKLFFEATLPGDSDLDGMRTDVDGNLYATFNGAGKIVKISPKGNVLQTILTTGVKGPSNLELGGEDGKTLFAIGRCEADAEAGCAASIQVGVAGRAFTQLNKAEKE
ncbi:hypothetical protein FQN55_004893 [Onygenales sp. PD_40]|nr:hypothetical protein FQN55_004893 [Onygenales sp. PD_40]KAK2770939.1 hypothetical protein FQN53_005293 [Emmonsiellopsis sp. PD_33]KAK2786384.1 hypothetical protein FQN52_007841 [Onygenales sp. PD_12]KAK2798653.1 hypothetical protein FQN51_007514 [Onygenales sp. PD_10]